jgi:hypothetical protein
MNAASVLSGCCKSRSRCCIYMHVASICFKCFQVFHTYVCECFIWMLHMFAIVFKCFSIVFVSVLDACFTCFTCILLYVVTVISGCFKSRSGITHGIHVLFEVFHLSSFVCCNCYIRMFQKVDRVLHMGRHSGRRGRRPRRRGTTAGVLPREPDELCARLLPLHSSVRTDVRALASPFSRMCHEKRPLQVALFMLMMMMCFRVNR